jgi:hypothetical protein
MPITTLLPKNLQAAYLVAYADCGDLELAAQCADTTPNEVRRTMKADAEFAAAVARERAKWTAKHVKNVADAGARDWKASLAILERNPETRERWSPPTIKTENKHTMNTAKMSDAELLAALGVIEVSSTNGEAEKPALPSTEGVSPGNAADAQ